MLVLHKSSPQTDCADISTVPCPHAGTCLKKGKGLLADACCEQGDFRASNEDAFAIDHKRGIYALSDGMGGHHGGKLASGIVIDRLLRELTPALDAPGGIDSNQFEQAVNRAIELAQRQMARLSEADAALHHMGATLAVTVVQGRRLYVAHLGDSRIYHQAPGRLTQLTGDHTFVAEMVRYGAMTPAQAEAHPFRNRLVGWVGAEESMVAPEFGDIQLRRGDRVILCSDGVSNGLSNPDILAELSAGGSPCQLARRMVRHAWDEGSKDNATCIVAEVTDG